MSRTPRPFTDADERHYIAGRILMALARQYPIAVPFSRLPSKTDKRHGRPVPIDVESFTRPMAETSPPYVEILIGSRGGQRARMTAEGMQTMFDSPVFLDCSYVRRRRYFERVPAGLRGMLTTVIPDTSGLSSVWGVDDPPPVVCCNLYLVPKHPYEEIS